MPALPEKSQQILQIHAALIHRVVMASHQRDLIPSLTPLIKASEENGWIALMSVVRQILKGKRDISLMNGLDEEDRIIVEAILEGIRNPASLPDPQTKADAGAAAPGLAAIIKASASGDAQALQLLASMAEQMSGAGGDMARLAAIMRRLVNGERDAELLTKGMEAQGKGLVLAILKELERPV
jgi:hypothetical protein